jgi:hypothetical protein
MSVKYSKWPQPISTFLRPSKINPSWDFWFETKPSGNPFANNWQQIVEEVKRFRPAYNDYQNDDFRQFLTVFDDFRRFSAIFDNF